MEFAFSHFHFSLSGVCAVAACCHGNCHVRAGGRQRACEGHCTATAVPGTAGTRGQLGTLQQALARTQRLVVLSSGSAPGKLPLASTSLGCLPSTLDITPYPKSPD